MVSEQDVGKVTIAGRGDKNMSSNGQPGAVVTDDIVLVVVRGVDSSLTTLTVSLSTLLLVEPAPLSSPAAAAAAVLVSVAVSSPFLSVASGG